MWILKRVLKTNRGVAAVEFALIFPLLMLILFGTIEFGILLYDMAVITNASREGARKGVVYAIRNDASGVTAAQDSATTKSSPLLINFGTASSPPSCSQNPCAIATNNDGNFASGSRITVSVYYNFQSLLLKPIIGEKLLTATTVMTYE